MNDSHFTPFYNRSLNHPNLLSLLRIVSRQLPILLITNYVNKMQYMQAKPHKKMQGGVTHVMIVACPSFAFAFMLLLISHAIITACTAFFVPVCFSIVIPTSFSIVIPTSFNIFDVIDDVNGLAHAQNHVICIHDANYVTRICMMQHELHDA